MVMAMITHKRTILIVQYSQGYAVLEENGLMVMGLMNQMTAVLF